MTKTESVRDPLLPAAHLLNILTAIPERPAFTLLLGAGASATSDVPLSNALIDGWRRQYRAVHGEGTGATPLEANAWYDTPGEYSAIFELLYDHPSQRRGFIEESLNKANPSWGYVYLVDLLRNNIFNTVFTTNFDDLLNESCYAFSDDVRPIVCAHDSSIAYLRLTSKRPKILKLHGDFLFDNIKNTQRELESLEGNMRDKLAQFASEYGMIVIGYAGMDRSVMDALHMLLRDPRTFPHGLYWCVTANTQPQPPVEQLLRFPRVKLIRISGFDEFMADLHTRLNIGLLPICKNPYGIIANRVSRLIASLLKAHGADHSPIRQSLFTLAENIADIEMEIKRSRLPFAALSLLASERNDVGSAKRLMILQLKTDPELRHFIAAAELIKSKDDLTFAQELVASLRIIHPRIWGDRAEASMHLASKLMNADLYSLATDVLDMGKAASELSVPSDGYNATYFLVNRMIAKVLGDQKLTAQEKDELQELHEDTTETDPYIRFCTLTLLSDREGALKAVSESETLSKEMAKMPVWKLYLRDAKGESGNLRNAKKASRRRNKSKELDQ
jgi:hypothetical protein